MSFREAEADPDQWANWLMRDRFSNDPDVERDLLATIEKDVDRLLEHAGLQPGMTLLDVGSGDGTVALRATERIGPELKVYVTDVSPRLLEYARQRLLARGVDSQCSFSRCAAQSLHAIADSSVDAVTTRAVIGYLPDKMAVLREFWRVLKPGGRISLAELIRRDEAFEVCALRKFVESAPDALENRLFHLLHRWKRTQFPDTEEDALRLPMTNFSERDLVSFAMNCGFEDVHMELHIDIGPAIGASWDALLESAPFPWSPTLRTLMNEQFSAEERLLFETVLRSDIGAGRMRTATRMAFLSATKPI